MNPEIVIDDMPAHEQDTMCRIILKCAAKMFERPEVKADYERWLKERYAK